MSTISRFRSRHQTLPLGGGAPPPDPPATPVNLEVTSNQPDEVSFSWDDTAGAEYYNLRIGPSGGPYTPVDGNPFYGTGGSLTGLDPDTEYCLEVQACNAGGCSAWSAQDCATTEPPAAPTVSASTPADLAGFGTTSTFNVTLPTAADGDTRFIFVSGESTVNDWTGFTGNPDWTLVSMDTESAGARFRIVSLWSRVKQPGDSDTVVFTAVNTGTFYGGAFGFTIPGSWAVDTASSLVDPSGTTMTPPDLTLTEDAFPIYFFGYVDPTYDPSLTELDQSTSTDLGWVLTVIRDDIQPAGPYAAETLTIALSSDTYCVLVAITGA